MASRVRRDRCCQHDEEPELVTRFRADLFVLAKHAQRSFSPRRESIPKLLQHLTQHQYHIDPGASLIVVSLHFEALDCKITGWTAMCDLDVLSVTGAFCFVRGYPQHVCFGTRDVRLL